MADGLAPLYKLYKYVFNQTLNSNELLEDAHVEKLAERLNKLLSDIYVQDTGSPSPNSASRIKSLCDSALALFDARPGDDSRKNLDAVTSNHTILLTKMRNPTGDKWIPSQLVCLHRDTLFLNWFSEMLNADFIGPTNGWDKGPLDQLNYEIKNVLKLDEHAWPKLTSEDIDRLARNGLGTPQQSILIRINDSLYPQHPDQNQVPGLTTADLIHVYKDRMSKRQAMFSSWRIWLSILPLFWLQPISAKRPTLLYEPDGDCPNGDCKDPHKRELNEYLNNSSLQLAWCAYLSITVLQMLVVPAGTIALLEHSDIDQPLAVNPALQLIIASCAIQLFFAALNYYFNVRQQLAHKDDIKAMYDKNDAVMLALLNGKVEDDTVILQDSGQTADSIFTADARNVPLMTRKPVRLSEAGKGVLILQQNQHHRT